MTGVRIRRFRDADARATAQVFFDSVHQVTRDFYDDAQQQAWAPRVPALKPWLDRIKPQTAFVAERDGAVIGFMTLRDDGYLDLAYVAPDAVGQGVAQALYDAILAEAATAGVKKLTADASHLARRFFERQGWHVVKEQSVERNGVALTNFRMEIHIRPGD